MLARRICLAAGTVLVAVAVIGPNLLPRKDYGWFAYGPDKVPAELQSMAASSLPTLAGVGILLLLAYLCFLGAILTLPPRRSVALALTSVAVPVAVLAVAVWQNPLPVFAEPAVLIAMLGIAALVALAFFAGQRAGKAWLAMVGTILLLWQAADHLSGAVSNAELAAARHPAFDEAIVVSVAVAVEPVAGLDLALLLPYVTTAAGVLLVLLGCLPGLGASRAGAPPDSA